MSGPPCKRCRHPESNHGFSPIEGRVVCSFDDGGSEECKCTEFVHSPNRLVAHLPVDECAISGPHRLRDCGRGAPPEAQPCEWDCGCHMLYQASATCGCRCHKPVAAQPESSQVPAFDHEGEPIIHSGIPLRPAGSEPGLEELLELARTARNYVRCSQDPGLSPYIKENGRRGGSPWAEFVEATNAVDVERAATALAEMEQLRQEAKIFWDYREQKQQEAGLYRIERNQMWQERDEWMETANLHQLRIAELERNNAHLRRLVRTYGKHTPLCAVTGGYDYDCTCGASKEEA